MILVRSILSITGTPSNGSLPIGNGQGFTVNTLTAGANVTITNGPGTITIAASGGGGTPAGSTNEIQYNNAGAFGANSNLVWDNTNSRLGIGIATPTAKVEVIGAAASGTTKAFAVHNLTGNNNALIVTNDGRVGIREALPATALHIGNTSDLNGNTTLRISSSNANASIIEFTDPIVGIGAFLATGPTFSFGTFLTNQLNLCSGASGGIAIRTNNSGNIRFYATNANFNFSTVQLQMFASTGNLMLQDGGTFTDIPSSRFTVNSTTQGFLPPRMTNAERLAIASPAIGLIVYCTDVVEGLYVYKSTGWTFII
jgi:hypothetical protein